MDKYTQELRDNKLLFLTTDEYDLHAYADVKERLINTEREFDIIVNERIKKYNAFSSLNGVILKDNFNETVCIRYITEVIADKSFDNIIECERDRVRLI